MAVISGNMYFGGIDHNEQIVSAGFKDEGSPLVAIGNSIFDSIEPPHPDHSFGKACVSTCGSRIVVEVHPDPNNLYESYLAFYDTETLQPIGLGTTNPGQNSILRFEAKTHNQTAYSTSETDNLYVFSPDDTVYDHLGAAGGYLTDGIGYVRPQYNSSYWTSWINGDDNYGQGIIPKETLPTTPDRIRENVGFLKTWLRPHGMVHWQDQTGTLQWAPMDYETVVHSPVPLRDKIAAIVEYKIPWTDESGNAMNAHGYGRYNSASTNGHMGLVCLGVFGLDGEVIAIHDLKFGTPSKMYLSSRWWKAQSRHDLNEQNVSAPPPYSNISTYMYETRMVSMGEYGCIKLSAHNGMVAIGCTFNQAHMYDTGTFDVYGPGDGVYLFRLGDSRTTTPKYFTNLRLPAGSYMDFFPEHLDMGSNYIVATGVPRGTGSTSTIFDQSTGQRQSVEYQIRMTNVTLPNISNDTIGYTCQFGMRSTTNTESDDTPYFTGINTSPHASDPYVRLYDMWGLLQAHIGKGTATDKISWSSTSTGFPIVNYDTRVGYQPSSGGAGAITIDYEGLSSVSLGSGKLVVGISSVYKGVGMVDIYHLKSRANIYPNANAVGDEAIWGESKRLLMDRNLYDPLKYTIDTDYAGPGAGNTAALMGKDVLINSQRIVIGSAEADTLFNDGNSLNIQYEDSGKVEVTNFDIPAYDAPYFFRNIRLSDSQYVVDKNEDHQYLFDSRGVLAGYATTNSKIEAKDFRSGVVVIGTEIGVTPAKIKVLLTPPQDTILDVLGEK